MNSDLLGIALVVDDIHKGCNLAFRYPAPPASLDHVSSFHKLSAPLIAKLFRPKNALCNESFELVIDDLRFISHPVLVPKRAAPTSVSANGSGPGAPAAAALNAPASSGSSLVAPGAVGLRRDNDTTMFNIIFALDEHRYQPFQQRQQLVPSEGSGDNASDGSSLTEDEDRGATMPSRAGDTAAQRQQHKQRIAAFRTIAAQLANGLLHEELRAGFVTREVRELLHIRDELVQNERMLMASTRSGNGSSSSSSAAGSVSGSTGTGGGSTAPKDSSENSTQGALEVDPQTLIDVGLGKSVLANDLKSVFHGLEEAGTAHVVINRWVKLSLTLTDAVSLKMQSMRPYQTLLLLADEESIVSALPSDHSYQLRVLISAASPLKSFQDLTLETSIPIHQLFRLAAHLVYWGYGRVIDTITMHNIYQVHPRKSLRSSSSPALEFRRKFPPHELCEVLSSFNGARRLGDSVKNLTSNKKVEYIHMLIWLLQRDFIVQLHRYVYFMIPSDQEAQADQNPTDSVENRSLTANSHASSVNRRIDRRSVTQHQSLVDKAMLAKSVPPANTSNVGFSDRERAYLDRIATTNPVFTLFKRLCVYFHGQYHLEEIMWRENVSRSELRTVLSTYQDIIVCCLHK